MNKIFLRGVLFFFALHGSISFSQTEQAGWASQFIANTIRHALSEDGVEPEVRSVSRAPKDVRRILSTNLKPGLLSKAIDISGVTYQFIGRRHTEEASVVIVRYPSSALCRQKKEMLEPLKGTFSRSEVLTRFSAVQFGNQLVISFSENSGDPHMVSAIASLPERFADEIRDHPDHLRQSK